MTAPVGAIVSLYVDLVERIGAGDIIETRTGRRYHVLEVREQQRGKHTGRQHLRGIVVDTDAEPDVLVYAGVEGNTRPGRVHRIRWYRRDRASGGVKGGSRR